MGCAGSEDNNEGAVKVTAEGPGAAENFGIIDADGGGTLDFEEMAPFGTYLPHVPDTSVPVPFLKFLCCMPAS